MHGSCRERSQVLYFGADSVLLFYALKEGNVPVGGLFISTGQNSAFTYHFLPTELLSPVQLSSVLQEHHTKEEWSELLHAFKAGVQSDPSGVEMAFSSPSKPLKSAIKPSKRF